MDSMWKRHALWALAFVVGSLLLAPTSDATVLRDLSLADLTRQADAIVIGTVGEGRSLRERGSDQIWTDTAISVEAVVKGKDTPSRLTLRQQGGQIGDEAMRVDGNARLVKGQRALLFLKVQKGLYFTVGMELGKFDITSGADKRQRVRRPSTVPVARVVERRDTSVMELAEADPTYEGATLSTILADIKALMVGDNQR